jgi:hypothetical protein
MELSNPTKRKRAETIQVLRPTQPADNQSSQSPPPPKPSHPSKRPRLPKNGKGKPISPCSYRCGVSHITCAVTEQATPQGLQKNATPLETKSSDGTQPHPVTGTSPNQGTNKHLDPDSDEDDEQEYTVECIVDVVFHKHVSIAPFCKQLL